MIRIGSRGSKLALIQANMVKEKIIAATGIAASEITIIPIQTTGDRIKEKNLSEIGGKGLFIKELEEELLQNKIDIAVHSLKDIPAIIPVGLKIDAVIERANPFDAFLSPTAKSLSELPQGAVLGTSSPRRAAQCLNLRPDLKIIPFRGNVGTRLQKLADKVADATILSVAGLERLGIDKKHYHQMDMQEMVPAIGQGAICCECRKDDYYITDTLAKINDSKIYKLVNCERIFSEGLNANCKTPVGGYAYIENDKIHFTGVVAKFDGSEIIKVQESGQDAEELGSQVLEKVKSQMTDDFFDK